MRAFRSWSIVFATTAAFASAAFACVGSDPDVGDDRTSDAGSESTTNPVADGASDGGLPTDDSGTDGAPEPDADIGPCNGTVHCARYVFHTSKAYTGGEIGGLAQADAFCKANADDPQASPLLQGRTWHAWLSTTAPDGGAVAQRLVHGTGPYRLVDGTVIANNWADLVDGTIDATLSMNEKGLEVDGNNNAWTGTMQNGTASTFTCGNWTDPTPGLSGLVGSVGATNKEWTHAENALSCAGGAGLYCIEH